MKQKAKIFVAAILGWQVRRLARKHSFKVIAITGSIGKTSTKLAVANVLSQSFRVRFQEGNYNDLVSVPLIYFDRSLPNIFNPFAWLAIFIKNEVALRQKYDYDFVIVEVGTDAPGQIAQFKKYIQADLGILTSVTPEHMEFFEDLDAVAEEELAIKDLCRQLLINADLVDKKYTVIPAKTYGIKNKADIRLTDVQFEGDQASFVIDMDGKRALNSRHQKITEPQLYSVCAAAAVGLEVGMEPGQIDEGIRSIPSVNGRMNNLAGVNGSTIIDDTYNASPEAMKAALDTLYRMKAPQKIAVLGNMNELGKFSEEAHRQIGQYCDPAKLDLVITIGPDANQYLAAAATGRGCEVKTFTDPYSAGKFLREQIKDKAAILVKGSQNKVFAEETVKLILAEPADASQLVRQSPQWLKTKRKNFS
jgi:UDP-N-acetylmuramoyl-tripeptide--D-alanyl-D-alanine ligase